MPCIDVRVDKSPRIDVETDVESRIKYEPEKPEPVKVEPVKPEMPEETEVKTKAVEGKVKQKESEQNVALVIMREDVKIDLVMLVIVVICVYLLAKFLR